MKYFDYAATTPLYPEVLETLNHSFKHDFANPNARHLLGQDLREQLEEQRLILKKLLNIKSNDHLYFTSCATESNNTVICGLPLKEDAVIFYTKSDHASMVSVIEHVARTKKISLIEYAIQNEGKIDLEDFEKKLILYKEKIGLVCLTSINNQSGAIQDIEAISKLIKTHSKSHIHVDAVQHFGKTPLFNPSMVDSISLSAHKIGGPKGIGALYLKDKHSISSLIIGGGQEAGFRSGTESLPLIKAFIKASEISLKDLVLKQQKVSEFKNKTLTDLQKIIPEIIYPFIDSSPYILSFILPSIASDIVVRHLETKNIFISTSSACSSKIKGLNPSLLALGIDEKFHKNFLRISFGPPSTKEEIEYLINNFEKVWNDLKKFTKNK